MSLLERWEEVKQDLGSNEKKALNLLFGLRVAELRAVRKWSLGDLSRRTGLDKETIRGIEAGDHSPKLETIWVLANAFEVKSQELIPTQMRVTRRANLIKKTNKVTYSQSTLDLPFPELQATGT